MVGSVGWGNMEPAELNRFEGGMGLSIDDVAVQLDKSLPQRRPNIILVHLGTNDVAWLQELETAPSKMEGVIDLVAETCPDAVLLVALIAPIVFRNDQVRDFNARIAEIVASRAAAGAHVMLVDIWAAFEAPGHPEYLSDVSHPNDEGFAVMAEVWLEGLQRVNGLGWIQEPVEQSSSR